MSTTASLPKTYRVWLLNEYAKGPINDKTFRLEEKPMPDVNALPDKHILVRVQRIAMEPSMRPSISQGKSYREPQPLNEPMWAYGMGEVVASTSDAYAVGKTISGMVNMQEYALIDVSGPVKPTVCDPRVGLEYLSGLGAPGRAAYWGFIEVGQAKAGEVVLVSAAAGATGSIVVQLAKAIGAAKIIGVASKSKVQAVLDNGADACLDYGAPDFVEQLKKVTEEKVTIYFDNTAGPITDAALSCMAPQGRIIACGAIGDYQKVGADDGSASYYGIKNWRYMVTMRLKVLGFVIPDCTPQEHQRTTEALVGYISKGQVKTIIHSHEPAGIANCIGALNGILSGANTGKMTIKVD